MSDPFLSASDLVELRALEVQGMFSTCDLYRSPAASGGKVGAPVLEDSAIACEIIPAARAERLGIAVPGLAGGRAALVGLLPHGTDVREGDELRASGVTYMVEGVGYHLTVVATALSEVRPR
jgi:hypothetical protein